MSDGEPSSTAEKEREQESERAVQTEAEASGTEATLDVEAAEEREALVDELRDTVEEQREQIEELEDLMLDMSTRAAHDGGTGVCPDCHGPVIKISSLFRSPKVKCTQCERVFHEY